MAKTDFLLAGWKGLEPSASGVTGQGTGNVPAVFKHLSSIQRTLKSLIAFRGSKSGPTKRKGEMASATISPTHKTLSVKTFISTSYGRVNTKEGGLR